MLAITDQNGKVVEKYRYDVYGEPEVYDEVKGKWWKVKGSLIHTRLFSWREYESEIGLYYNRARYYDPEYGRFISRDPIGYADDVNFNFKF